MDKLLTKLIDSFSVSGNEKDVKNIITKNLKELPHEINEDKMGNLIVKTGKGSSKIMICANMDSIGFIASYIEKNGLIRVEKIGEFKNDYVVNSFVKFNNGSIGKIFKDNDKLFVDIGFNTKDVVSEKVNIGDSACFVGPYLKVGEGSLISPSLDNKVGCYILLRLLKEKLSSDKEVYFVFSTEEQLGGRGARAAAYEIDPDFCIILGTEKAKDISGSEGKVELTKGPVLKIMDRSLIMHEDIKKMLECAADKANVKIQYSISTGTSEGGLVHKERAGIKTGEVCVPCRYKQSTSEMVNIKDIEDTINLLKELI